MRFGMFTDFHIRPGASQSEAFAESFRQVDAAEALGLDSVWLAEHHFSPDRSVLASPLVIAGSIATRTERLRIGLAVQVLPLASPLRIAEEASTVDQISQGRLDFGVGRSGLTKYYHGYNVPYEESRPRFIEALDVITKAWTQDTFSYQGDYYTYKDVTLVPQSYQRPHPPVFVALASEDTFPLVGKLGHPIFISSTTPLPQLKERLALYWDARKAAGHNGNAQVALRIPAYVSETSQGAMEEPRESAQYFIRYAAEQLISSAASQEAVERFRQAAAAPYEQIANERFLFGSPQQVVERLQMYQEELGINAVVLEMNYGGRIPYDRVINSIRLLCEKVIPSFN